jgi:hemolysin activation/secretion protein
LGFTNYSDTNIANDFSTGFGYYFEGRYYFSSTKDKMTGWHIGPSVNIAKTTSKKTATVYESNIYSLTAGSQWIFESKLSFEFFLAVGYQDIKASSRTLNQVGLPVMPSGGISVGYAF